jgi:ribosomal protein S27E
MLRSRLARWFGFAFQFVRAQKIKVQCPKCKHTQWSNDNYAIICENCGKTIKS